MLSIKIKRTLMDCAEMIDKDTLAWRAMLAREEKGLKQTELVDLMNKPPYNLGVTTGSYSKIETGDTLTPKHAVLIAMSEILEVSLDTLIAGKYKQEQQTVDAFVSEEANRIGAMVDKMSPSERSIIEDVTRMIYEMAQTIRAQEDQIWQYQDEVAGVRLENKRLRKLISHDIDGPKD